MKIPSFVIGFVKVMADLFALHDLNVNDYLYSKIVKH